MIRFLLVAPVALVAFALVVPAVVLVIPLWLFSACLHGLERLLRSFGSSGTQVIEFQEEIGWKPRPLLRTAYFDIIGDRCTVRTDKEGWPGSQSIEESDVVVFGDSFAFGYGSSDHRAYYSLTAGCRVKAIAAPGYNTVQALMLMRRYAARLRGKFVVWFICMENDIAENLKPYNPLFYTNPFLRWRHDTAGWEIVTDHVRRERWANGDPGISNLTLFASLCLESEYADRAFTALRHLIMEGKKLCDTNGARLQILSIPYHLQFSEVGRQKIRKRLADTADFDVARPEQRLAQICEAVGVPFMKGSDFLTLSDYKRRDGHWNRQGNRKMAGVIAAASRDADGLSRSTGRPAPQSPPVETGRNAEPGGELRAAAAPFRAG
jgi:hypothetical protein